MFGKTLVCRNLDVAARVAKDAGVQPIVGCQFDVAHDPGQPGEKLRLPAPLVLRAQSEAGNMNLMKRNSP